MDLDVQSIVRKSRQLAVVLSPYHLKIKKVRRHDLDFAQLLQTSITPSIGLDESLRNISSRAKQSASVRLNPEILYARLPPTFAGIVLSFEVREDRDARMFEGCSWILWQLPE